MKSSICAMLIAVSFFSCNKLQDYLPKPNPEPQLLPEFNKVYGGSDREVGISVAAGPDGTYAFAGGTFSNDGDVSGYHGDGDAWVVKLDKSGNKVWQKAIGGSSIDRAYSITASTDGGYVMAGFTLSTDGNVISNHGGYDALIVKLDADGTILWQKTLGGTGGERFYSIVKSADGGYLMLGYTSSYDGDVSGNHGQDDAWIVKVDGNGNLLWQKTLGGSADDLGFAITSSSDGGCVMAGRTFSDDGDVSGFHGEYDTWVVKLDNEGKIEWKRALGGSQGDDAYSITSSSDGGYVIGSLSASRDGDLSGIEGTHDCWIVKLDKDGKIVWQKLLGQITPNGITEAKGGGYTIVGTIGTGGGDIVVVKLDTNGSIITQKTWGGAYSEEAGTIVTRSDGTYVVAGTVSDLNGQSDAWVFTINDE